MATYESSAWGITISAMDNRALTTEVPLNKFQVLQGANTQVFEPMAYLTGITYSRNPNGLDMSLTYSLDSSEVLLDDYRTHPFTENEYYEAKTNILNGLLELLYLVSEGKLYNIPLNPLNFVFDEVTYTVKAFYRDVHELPEINDEWMHGVYKLLAYFMVDDSSLIAEDYDITDINSMLMLMDDRTKNVFTTLVGLGDIEAMTRSITENLDEGSFENIQSFPAWDMSFKKPRNTSSRQGFQESTANSGTVALDENDVKQKGKGKKERKQKPQKQQQAERPRKEAPKKENRGGGNSGSKLFVGLMAGLIIGVGGMFGYNKFIAPKDDASSNTSVQMNEDFYHGLLGASIQKYDLASTSFDKFYEDATDEVKGSLSSDEKVAVFFAYLLDGQYDKALSYDPTDSNAELVITYLKAKSEGEFARVLPTLTSDLAPIQFEKAVIDKNYETIASLKDKVKYTENKTRQNLIAEALTKTDDIEGAVVFADSLSSKELLNAIKAWGYEVIDAKTDGKDAKDKEKIALTNQLKDLLKSTTNLTEKDLG